jgi:epsin
MQPQFTQQLQPQFTQMQPQFTAFSSFNPYQQQAQQEAMQV